MKKMMILVLVGMMVLVAASAFAGVANTKHNLTSAGTASHTTNTNATLCGFCHIPHGANITVAGAPLWGRQLESAKVFQLYGGGLTLANTTVNQPGANSLTCLSCHDGAISMGVTQKYGINDSTYASGWAGAYTDATGFMQAGAGSYRPQMAGATNDDLRDDHPIGIAIVSGAAGLDTAANITGRGYKLYAANTRVECASCHDPHIDTTTKFKRATTGGNDFCVGCHISK